MQPSIIACETRRRIHSSACGFCSECRQINDAQLQMICCDDNRRCLVPDTQWSRSVCSAIIVSLLDCFNLTSIPRCRVVVKGFSIALTVSYHNIHSVKVSAMYHNGSAFGYLLEIRLLAMIYAGSGYVTRQPGFISYPHACCRRAFLSRNRKSASKGLAE